MNTYKPNELQVGMTAEFRTDVTAEMLQKFCEISGDINPLHISEEYAKKRGYPGRVVYGMLTASFYSTLAGVYLPGENCLLYSVESKFTNPVFVGDSLTVSGKIAEINETMGFIVVKAQIRNQRDETVSRGKIMAGVWDEQE